MEPISSSSSARASASQPPVPVQQKRDSEALTAQQPPSSSYTATAPGQDLQLQRRQVVEDIGKNQKVTDQLQGASEQLKSARGLAQQASASNVSGDERENLSKRFSEAQSGLGELAESVKRSGVAQGSAERLRVSGSVATPDDAKETTKSIDASLAQVNSDLDVLVQQGQALGNDFPRIPQKSNSDTSVQNKQQATQLAAQLQRQVQTQPDNALSSQANVSRQTALTLFQ